METLTLEAQERQVAGKQVSKMRLQGIVPAVVYGHGVPTKNIAIDNRTFQKLYAKAGESSLVDLAIAGGAPVKALVQEVQYDPLLGEIIHVDFRQIKMDEALEVEVLFQFVGEAPAVKAFGAIMVKNMDKLTVRCLPKDLVHEIMVDITGIKNFGDLIKVKDLKLPAGLEAKADGNDVIILAQQPISEAELAALDTKPEASVADVKVATDEKKKAKEEAATAEGGEEKK